MLRFVSSIIWPFPFPPITVHWAIQMSLSAERRFLRLEVLTTTLVTFKPWHCPWCELTCPEFSPEVRIAQGCSAEDQKVLPPPLRVQSSCFWQKVIHIHLTFYWGAGTISCSSEEHVWTNSTADLPQAYSKETVSVITPGSGVWAKLRGRRESANRTKKGRHPAQSAPSVTAEQGDFVWAAPRVKALKADLLSPLGEKMSRARRDREQDQEQNRGSYAITPKDPETILLGIQAQVPGGGVDEGELLAQLSQKCLSNIMHLLRRYFSSWKGLCRKGSIPAHYHWGSCTSTKKA